MTDHMTNHKTIHMVIYGDSDTVRRNQTYVAKKV